MRRRFGSVAKAAVSLGFTYHRIRRVAAGQKPATEEEWTLINDATGCGYISGGTSLAHKENVPSHAKEERCHCPRKSGRIV